MGEKRGGGGVEIDAHRVHRILNHGIERLGQPVLVDIVLILADPDALGLDLDQFGQRVLQAPGDGNRAAQRHVEPGELGGSGLGGRIDRGAGFRDDDLERLGWGHMAEHVGYQLFGFARAGAIADGDQLDPMGTDELGQLRLAAADVIARREGIDRGSGHELAGAVDHGDLDAGADPGIEPHSGAGAGGRGQQQVLEIAREDGNSLLVGAFAQVAHQVEREMQRQLDAPGPAGDLEQPEIAR